MPGTVGPNLGVTWGYSPGENGWGVGGFNPDFARLDTVVHLAVIEIRNATPVSPSNGDRYIVGATPTGAFTAHTDDIAVYLTTGTPGWVFYTPKLGWRTWNEDTSEYLRFDGADWVSDSGATLAVDDLTDVVAPTPSDGDALTWDSGTSKWINQAPPSGVSTIDDLTDVTITSAADGDILVMDSGQWVNVRPKYIIGASIAGVLTNSQQLLYHRFSTDVTLPADFADYLQYSSEFGGTANATASTVIVVEKAANATPNAFSSAGTLTVAAGTTTVTPSTSASPVTFAKGDVIRIMGPASADATFAGFYGTLVFYET